MKDKFMEVHDRRMLAVELDSAQGIQEIGSDREESQVGHHVDEDALNQGTYKQHMLENQLPLPCCERKAGARVKYH